MVESELTFCTGCDSDVSPLHSPRATHVHYCWKVFLKLEISTFIQQGHFKLIKSDSKVCYK